ncbi:MFS transporter [Streptomyces cellulosae]|uniref:MFS transporter n=1 Tax=unclassified Streptomyces TaxID=2593676 RepID=UPI001BE5671E|nr:MFS transporter [Streptomyces sp. MD20-1-1]WUC45874.1 MFS transporter [Streptomyces cellulosae]
MNLSSHKPAQPSDHPPPSPYRWVVLIACWVSFTLTSIDRSTWGPASVFVGESLAVPLASLGAFATAYYVGYVVSNALGGMGVDRYGGRIMLTVSLLGAGIGMTAFGSTTSATVGIALQALVGLFAGADYSAGIRLITSWFPAASLGLPMGLFTTATSLGTAIANTVVPAMIAKYSWHTSYHTFGIVSIVLAGLLFFLVRPGPMLDADESRSDRPARRLDLGALVRNRSLVLTCLTGFCGFWGLYGFITWANALMIKGHSVTPATAGLVVSVFAVTAIAVKPAVGYVTDRFFGGARRTPTIAILAVFGGTLVCFGELGNPNALIWLAPLLGAAAYGWTPLVVALVPRLVPPSVTGSASGIANATWQLGSVVVPVVVGMVFSATGSFSAAFLALAAGPFTGCLIMLAVRERSTAEAGTPQEAAPAAGSVR